MRLLVPDQRLRPGHGGKSTKSYPLDQQQGPGSFALQKKIPKEMGSSETSEVFIRRNRVQYVWIGTWVDLERVLWAISSEFPVANHFDLAGLEAIFGIPQEIPMCAHVSLSQDGFW